jgi:hypothetical protein
MALIRHQTNKWVAWGIVISQGDEAVISNYRPSLFTLDIKLFMSDHDQAYSMHITSTRFRRKNRGTSDALFA